MNMRVWTAACCFLIGVNSAWSQEIFQKKDDFSGSVHYFTKNRDVRLEGGSFMSMRYVHFSLHAFSSVSDPSAPYILDVSTSTPDWVFIESGGSLILKLDGSEMLTLSGPGSIRNREVIDSSTLLENAAYSLSQDQLEHIGHAKSVDFRILGERQNITGSWKGDLIADASSLAAKGPTLFATQPMQGAVPVSSKESATPTPPCPAPEGTSAGEAPPKLGVRFVSVNQQIAEHLHLKDQTGVLIGSVEPGSVGASAGLRAGDIILRVGDRSITQLCDLPSYLRTVTKGSIVPVAVFRAGAEVQLQAQF